jgi:pimeloyl-ACP methyl ester carboxylesterase
MAKFVLIHGAWHGAWCWEELVPLLEAAGHEVLAPDLPGMGGDETPLSAVDLAGWGRWVADLVGAQSEPVMLVGHSRGGIVISQAAELRPEKIAWLVYLTAFLVPDGETMIDARARIETIRPFEGVQLAEDGTTSVAPDAIGPAMYNCTSAKFVDLAIARLCPEPGWVFREALRLTPERYGSIPRAYIETLQDNAISIAFQRDMQSRLPCDPVITLDTDHSPFFSMPRATADALAAIAARADGAKGIAGA